MISSCSEKYLHKEDRCKADCLKPSDNGLICNKPPYLEFTNPWVLVNLFANDVLLLTIFAAFALNIYSERRQSFWITPVVVTLPCNNDCTILTNVKNRGLWNIQNRLQN